MSGANAALVLEKKRTVRKSDSKLKVFDPRNVSDLAPGEYHFDDVVLPELLQEDNDRVIKTYSQSFQELVESVRSATRVREEISLFYDPTKEKVLIKSGHRRTKAVMQIRYGSLPFHAMLPVKVKIPHPENIEKDSRDQEIVAVISNFQRENLKGVERARSMARLSKAGLSIAEISRLMSVNRKTIERSLNIALLPDDVQLFMLENSEKVTEREAIRVATLYKVKQSEGMSEPEAKLLIQDDLKSIVNGNAKQRPEEKAKKDEEGIFKINIELLEAKMKLEKIPPAISEKIISIIKSDNLV